MSVVVWIGSLLLLSAAVPAERQTDASDLVQGVQHRYDNTTDLTADVEQEIVVASAERTLRSQGTVAFKRPGKMRWVLHNHEEQIIVADGKTLWFYQPEERQVLKAPFDAAFRSSAPISFLTGVGRITENFEVTLEERGLGVAHLNLLPRKRTGEVGRLRLAVVEATYDIVAADILDALGNETRIRFKNLARNVGLSDEVFRFEIPAGVDVIEAPIGY